MSTPYSPYNPVPGSREPVPGSQGAPTPWDPFGSQPPQDSPPPGWAAFQPQPPQQPPQAAAAPDTIGADPLAALQLALQRIDQLEQQLRQQNAGVGADIPKLAGPTHDLYLADGTHVENWGAIPTHVHLADDRVMPVAWAVERRQG